MSAVTRALARQAEGLTAAGGAIWQLRDELRPHRKRLGLAFAASLAYTALQMLEPWPLKVVLDNVIGGRPMGPWLQGLGLAGADGRTLVAVCAAAIVVTAVARGFLYQAESLLAARVGQSVVAHMRQRVFNHLLRLPVAYHIRAATGDLLTRLTSDMMLLRELLVGALSDLLSEGIVLIGFLVVMFVLDWRLALAATAMTPLLFGLLSVFSTRIRAAAQKQRRKEGQLASQMHEVLSGIHVVQMFTGEDAALARLDKTNRQSVESGLVSARLEAKLNRAVETTLAVAMATTVGYGALRVQAGALTPGELVVFASYLRSFYKPLKRIARIAERSSKAATCVDRITELLDVTSDVPDGHVAVDRLRGDIAFKGVGHAYPAGTPVLRAVDRTVRAGQTVALVGLSGAGKSTLLGLIPRLYDPTEGRLVIDGRDVRDYTLASLRAQIAVVPQDGVLFAGTVQDNIAFGRPDASFAEIVAAAEAACIHGFISGLPDGYQTPVGERGLTLSGGQRQRIAIARALVRNAPIVLLDEPTTGLDAESEAAVLTAIDRLLVGRTALVIAHRLSTVQAADAIWVVEGGRIAASGTHDELLAGNARYRGLYALQSRATVARPAEPRAAAAPGADLRLEAAR